MPTLAELFQGLKAKITNTYPQIRAKTNADPELEVKIRPDARVNISADSITMSSEGYGEQMAQALYNIATIAEASTSTWGALRVISNPGEIQTNYLAISLDDVPYVSDDKSLEIAKHYSEVLKEVVKPETLGALNKVPKIDNVKAYVNSMRELLDARITFYENWKTTERFMREFYYNQKAEISKIDEEFNRVYRELNASEFSEQAIEEFEKKLLDMGQNIEQFNPVDVVFPENLVHSLGSQYTINNPLFNIKYAYKKIHQDFKLRNNLTRAQELKFYENFFDSLRETTFKEDVEQKKKDVQALIETNRSDLSLLQKTLSEAEEIEKFYENGKIKYKISEETDVNSACHENIKELQEVSKKLEVHQQSLETKIKLLQENISERTSSRRKSKQNRLNELNQQLEQVKQAQAQVKALVLEQEKIIKKQDREGLKKVLEETKNERMAAKEKLEVAQRAFSEMKLAATQFESKKSDYNKIISTNENYIKQNNNTKKEAEKRQAELEKKSRCWMKSSRKI